MGAPDGHPHIFVAHQLHDGSEVSSLHGQMRGEAMAKVMKPEIPYAGPLDRPSESHYPLRRLERL